MSASARVIALAAAVALATVAAVAADEAATREIEALIASVDGLTDAIFVRNGEVYSAASAARFLREKWRSRQSEVHTAEDFVDRIASFSSTTGKPYRIRFADRREIESAAFLRGELAKLRAEKR